jgi:hypothetical protein
MQLPAELNERSAECAYFVELCVRVPHRAETLRAMADWVISAMENSGYLMVATLMFLENVFPPIPSALVMPLAGYSAERGDLNIW